MGMIGVRSCGIYVPRWRIGREAIGAAWGSTWLPAGAQAGERSFGWFDEDAVTMAVEACLDCMANLPTSTGGSAAPPDGILFASSTLSGLGSSAAAIVSESVGLASTSKVLDLVSLGAGTSALLSAADSIKSNSISSALIVASETMQSSPGTREEMFQGDAAVAFLLSEEGCIANLLGSFSLTRSQRYGRHPEVTQVVHDLTDAIRGLFKKYNLSAGIFKRSVISAPDREIGIAVARRVGIEEGTIGEDQIAATVGYSGASHPFLMLAAVLEESKPGDTILLAGFGDGADALIFEVTKAVTDFQKRLRLARALSAKRRVDAYGLFLTAKGIIAESKTTASTLPRLSKSLAWPYLSLSGTMCQACGIVVEPGSAKCGACGSENLKQITIPRRGRIAEGARPITPRSPWLEHYSSPVVLSNGMKLSFPLTDLYGAVARPSDEVELVFRYDRVGNASRYCWKCAPRRLPDATQLTLKTR